MQMHPSSPGVGNLVLYFVSREKHECDCPKGKPLQFKGL